MTMYRNIFTGLAEIAWNSLKRRRLSLTVKELEEKRKELIKKLDSVPLENIRNFSIIAHVDHGKSTLADRILEMTGALTVDPTNKQVLDRLQVERERGITVKAQTASLIYKHKETEYLLNLIDTPGHVDFSNEVSRSLAACQGVVLLVDANQGVQAQTVANFYLAFTQELAILPVLNKVDLKNANPDLVAEQLKNLFSIKPEEIVKISAKLGTNVDQVLRSIVEKIPHPPVDRNAKLQALLFDSWYDKYRGALGLIYVKNGQINLTDAVKWCHSDDEYVVKSLGILSPDEEPVKVLKAGQVGVIGCNMRSTAEALIGSTLVHVEDPAEPLPGLSPAKPMVFAGIYPFNQSDHILLSSALEKLTLNDNAVSIKLDSSAALGQGWRLGFLGLLHMEVFTQRLEQEYNVEAIVTSPSVTYKVKIIGKKNIERYGSEELFISNPALLPDSQMICEMEEPFILGTIITPDAYLGDVISLCLEKRGRQQHATNIDNSRVLLQFVLPLNEIVVDFHDRLKTLSSGFASFDYEDRGYEPSNLVKVEILLNGNTVEEFSTIVHVSKSGTYGRKLVKKLVEIIPRQQFKIIIQAKVGGNIIGREEVKPYRKDVSAKLGGKRVGDMTRLKKLLKQQAEGKKKMKMVGNIALPRETFIKALKR